MILKEMSWGIEVRWEGGEKHPAEVSESQGRLWKFPNGSCTKAEAELHQVHIPVLQSGDAALGCLHQPGCKKHLHTKGLADSARSSHLYLKSSQQNDPGLRGAVQLWQSYSAESSVVLPQSTVGTGIGYSIVPGMWHVLAGLSSPGLLFCSQIRDVYLNQGRFKLKKKKITLKYNPLLK